MKRSSATTRQRKDPLGDTTGASTNVCLLVLFALRSNPQALPYIRCCLIRRDLEPSSTKAETSVIQLAVERERVAAARVANKVILANVVPLNLWNFVRRPHVRAPASADDMRDPHLPAP